MGRGGTKVVRIDISDVYDPRLAPGRAAAKGTLFRYIPAVGDPELLIKADDGLSVNWIGFGTVMPITIVQAGSVANVNIAVAPAALDGVPGVVGDKWLLKNQAAPAENGVYDYNGVGVPLTRSEGWDAANEFVPGKQVFIDAGTIGNDDTLWANADIVTTLGVDPVQFVLVSGAIVVGDPNTMAYYDAAGAIASNPSAKFSEALNAMAVGIETAGGVVNATNAGAHAHGRSDEGIIVASGVGSHSHGETTDINSNVEASASGSHAHGISTNEGEILASANGSHAHGNAQGVGTQILSSGIGARTHGFAIGTSVISALGDGCEAGGVTTGTGTISASSNGTVAKGVASGSSQITTGGGGAQAHGLGENAGVIASSGQGSDAFGHANDGTISSTDSGSSAHGLAQTGGIVSATASSAHAHGTASGSGTITASAAGATAHGSSDGVGSAITASGEGAHAHGSALAGNTITALGAGSHARGLTAGFNISATGSGSYAGGVASTATIGATGIASFAHGDANNVSADLATAFGLGNDVGSYASLVIGRYAVPGGTAGAWVATEQAFVIGNGTGVGTEANAYQVDKDGKQTTTGAHRNTAIRLVAAPAAISARIDRTIVYDTTVAAVNDALTLPAGEDGLEFLFTSSGAGAGTYTITPAGGDVLDTSVTAALAAGVIQGIIFLGGTWYSTTN